VTDASSPPLSAPGASVGLVGVGDAGRRAVERCRKRRDERDPHGQRAAAEAGGGGEQSPAVGACLVAVAPGDAATESLAAVDDVAAGRTAVVLTTASTPDGRVDPAALDRLRRSGDAVVVCPGGGTALTDGVERLVRLLDTRSVVNLDVADLVTVLQRGDVAAFAHGRGDARTAVERAFAGVPANLRVESAPAALVHVVGGPSTSVEAVGEVVDAVRGRVDTDAHLIWGTSIVDGDGRGDGLELELVAGGVAHLRDADDPCPRCGASLVGYSLGERSTVVCDRCGFSGNAVRLR
jgi:hypothetical protein